MFERALNIAWIVVGAGAAAHATTIGVMDPSGPGSGLFPLVSGLLVAACGLTLLFAPSHRAPAPDWPRGTSLARVLGVVAGLAVMAIGIQYLGFAVAGVVTMVLLLRTVERTSWGGAIALAFGSVAATVWLFEHTLGMPLPRGPWGW